jgi:membrane protease YdiL (CAAX protease family)
MLSVRNWKFEEIIRLLTCVFGCLIGFLLLQMGLQLSLGSARFGDGSFLLLFFSSMSLHGSFIIGTAIYMKWNCQNWAKTFGIWNGPLWKIIGLGLLAAVIFLPLGEILQRSSLYVLDLLHIKTHPQAAVEEFNRAKTWLGKIYLAVFAVIIAPMAEEIIFRGLLHRGLRQLTSRRNTFLVSASLFAVIHANLPIFFPLLVLGMILAWLYECTDNLLTPMLAHAAFNGINVLLLFYDAQGGALPHTHS